MPAASIRTVVNPQWDNRGIIVFRDGTAYHGMSRRKMSAIRPSQGHIGFVSKQEEMNQQPQGNIFPFKELLVVQGFLFELELEIVKIDSTLNGHLRPRD